MPNYIIGSSAEFAAEGPSVAFDASVTVRNLAEQIFQNPGDHHAAKYLGHACLIWARESVPVIVESAEGPHIDVVGLAINPQGSVIQETHPVWWSTGTDANGWPGYTDFRGGCAQLVREPGGSIQEYGVEDDDGQPIPDKTHGGARAALVLAAEIDNVARAGSGGSRSSGSLGRLIYGPEALAMAAQYVPNGHEFRHPALQAFFAEHVF